MPATNLIHAESLLSLFVPSELFVAKSSSVFCLVAALPLCICREFGPGRLSGCQELKTHLLQGLVLPVL